MRGPRVRSMTQKSSNSPSLMSVFFAGGSYAGRVRCGFTIAPGEGEIGAFGVRSWTDASGGCRVVKRRGRSSR